MDTIDVLNSRTRMYRRNERECRNYGTWKPTKWIKSLADRTDLRGLVEDRNALEAAVHEGVMSFAKRDDNGEVVGMFRFLTYDPQQLFRMLLAVEARIKALEDTPKA